MVYKGTSILGEYVKSSRQKGKVGLPLLSVTLNDGLVDREGLVRRTETTLDPEDHLLVKAGDIAYNMMRMWQGASGRASKDGVVSPAYVVLSPKGNVDSRYLAHMFKSPKMIYLFWAYSYGLTKDRLRLYFNDLQKIPVVFPGKQEQTKIAEILSTWDKAITSTEQLLSNSKQQKKALIQQLLTGKKRFPEFEGVWQEYRVESLVSLGKKKFESKKAISHYECIELEHIEQGTGRLLDSTQTKETMSTKSIFDNGDVLFGKLRPYLRKYWLADRPGVCSTEIWVLKAQGNIVLPEYLFQLVQTERFIDATNISSGTHMPRADWNVVKDIAFKLPTIEEQQKITSVLSAADLEIDALQQGRSDLMNEKKALMQQLLTVNGG